MLGIEIPPHRRAAPAAGAAMQNHHRNPVRITALFHVKAVPLAHVQHALIKRCGGRVKKLCCALLAAALSMNVLYSVVRRRSQAPL